MAWTVSGLYFPTHRDQWDLTQLGVDLDAEDLKIALYDDTETPNYSTETAYAATNEVSGTGWAAGGVVLTGTAVDESPAGTMRWDATDVSETGTTLVDSFGAKIYDDTNATVPDALVVGIDFPAGDYSTNNGTLAITFDTTGVLTIDLTP